MVIFESEALSSQSVSDPHETVAEVIRALSKGAISPERILFGAEL